MKTTIIIIATIILMLPISSIADNCQHYQNQINRYTELRRKGGSGWQMNDWAKKRNEAKFAYNDCRRNTESGSIDKVRRPGDKKNYADYQNPYHSKIQDQELQQLIKTCNYWISQHNNKPSWDNRNYRNTACRAAREKEQSITNPKPKIPANVRSVKECIKPNNLMDDEVKDCVQGKIPPYWKETKSPSKSP